MAWGLLLESPFSQPLSDCCSTGHNVSQAYTDGQWNIQFRIQLHEVLIEEWDQLQDMLSEVTLEDRRDIVYWALEQSKKYSTGSLYRFITFGGVRDQQMMNVWKCNYSRIDQL